MRWQQLTYEQLNSRANQIAHHLSELGVGPDVLVGVYVDRSLEMMVGLLGVLKASGAFVPLSPGTPAERLATCLHQCQSPVVLTQQKLAANLPTAVGQIVCLDCELPTIDPISRCEPEWSRRASEPGLRDFYIWLHGETQGCPNRAPGDRQFFGIDAT